MEGRRGRAFTALGQVGISVHLVPPDPKLELQKWEGERNRAIRDKAYEEENGTEADKSAIEDYEETIKEADLRIRKATIELALSGGEKQLREILEDQLKEAEKDLEEFKNKANPVGAVADAAGKE